MSCTIAESDGTVLSGSDLGVTEVCAVARDGSPVSIDPEALQRVGAARLVVEHVLASGEAVYGLNTGLGSLSHHRIPLDEMRRFSFATVAEQIASNGPPLPTDIVRAMMLTRANTMAKAGVGVRRELLQLIIDVLNAHVHPIVRAIGSVGQGDLSEMADIGKVLIGRGRAEYQGTVMSGEEALRAAGLRPIELAPKEALALISANGVTMGFGSLVLIDVADLIESSLAAAALSMEGFRANLSIIHPAASKMRPHEGLRAASRRLRGMLQGSDLWLKGAARNLQDPLSFRCLPQTHGALYDAFWFARKAMEVELNSAGDNPLIVVEEDEIVSVGNFDVVELAMAFDLVRLAIAQTAQVSNERVQKLLWSHFSGLPTGLAREQGATGGMRALGRSYAALTARTRLLANPVSLDYRGQLAEGVEDHASMAPLAVKVTSELVSLMHRLIAIELLVGAQAVDLRDGAERLGRGTKEAYGLVREHAAMLVDETEWMVDLDGLADIIGEGELARRMPGAPTPWPVMFDD